MTYKITYVQGTHIQNIGKHKYKCTSKIDQNNLFTYNDCGHFTITEYIKKLTKNFILHIRQFMFFFFFFFFFFFLLYIGILPVFLHILAYV